MPPSTPIQGLTAADQAAIANAAKTAGLTASDQAAFSKLLPTTPVVTPATPASMNASPAPAVVSSTSAADKIPEMVTKAAIRSSVTPDSSAAIGSPEWAAYQSLPNYGVSPLPGYDLSGNPTLAHLQLPDNFIATHDMTDPKNVELWNNSMNVIGPKQNQAGQEYIKDSAGNTMRNPNYDPLQNPQYLAVKEQNDKLIAQTDAYTADMIKNIQALNDARVRSISQISQSQQDQQMNSLLTHGGARYAQESSSGIMSVMASKLSNDIFTANAEAQQAILQAQIAGQNKDYELMSKTLAKADELTKQRDDALKAASDLAIKEYQAQKEKEKTATMQGEIAKAYTAGTTDPAAILAELQAGGDTTSTLKDITDAITNMNPEQKAVMDLMTTAKNNGATPEVLAAIDKSGNLSAAYLAAGKYGAGGTGIVGEYNYARANGYSGSFSQYQNEDANRKRAASTTASSGVGVGGVATYAKQAQDHAKQVLAGNETMQQVPAAWRDQVAAILSNSEQESYSPLAASRFTMASARITSPFTQLPQYQLTANGLPYLQRIDAAMKTPGSVSDQDLLDSLTKLNTAGNAITDAQVRLITDGRSFSDSMNVFKNKLSNGGVLSDNQRQQIQEIAQNIYKNYQKGYQPVFDQASTQLTNAGIPKSFWTIPDLNNLSGQYQKVDSIVADDKAAAAKVSAYYTAHTDKQAGIDKAIQNYEAKYGVKPSYSQLLQVFPEIQ